MKEDDNNWPMPDRVGKQELEIRMNGEHICFNTTKLGSVLQVQSSKDPDGLRIFYYLVQVSRGFFFNKWQEALHIRFSVSAVQQLLEGYLIWQLLDHLEVARV